MQGHDIGIRNAMKIELAVQLAKAKEREAKKNASGAAQRPALEIEWFRV